MSSTDPVFKGPMRAVVEAQLMVHRQDKWRWLTLGGTEESWTIMDKQLSTKLSEMPEIDYP